ncbi:hypothetical protein QA600_13400 [Natronococcus sp. A-GB1]|nr:hypothetical protein [Natronococcus sp. A-GB1]MDG5760333.1 hypothetical protein [Natronococcus sp. A-GB1]
MAKCFEPDVSAKKAAPVIAALAVYLWASQRPGLLVVHREAGPAEAVLEG